MSQIYGFEFACAGPFITLIFADSIASLTNTAPLIWITKPWRFAEWRFVFTIWAFNVSCFLFLRLCNDLSFVRIL